MISLVRAGFDFGDGCEGGSGSFEVSLDTAGERRSVGIIPSGKWHVKVRLTANKDVDVQLYDLNRTDTFSEGKAIVAWCENARTCNIGALGSDATEGSTTYEQMQVSYSGYEGVDGKPGKEWISIKGESLVHMEMFAFAFETGNATVEYEYDRVQTACCLGVAPCGGSFTSPVAEGGVVDIGEIPTGKKNLFVNLVSSSDVDIQLFDLDDADCASGGGRAIIAYTENDTPGACDRGTLGNNDGTPESTVHQGLTYQYSGYYGGQTAATYGHEYVNVTGVTNRRLMMKAYGYAAGDAVVTYSYYEDFDVGTDASIPTTPGVDWLVSRNHENHHTNAFLLVPNRTLIVRRGRPFTYVVSSGALSSVLTVQTSLGGGVVSDNSDDSLNTNDASYPSDKIDAIRVVDDGNTRKEVIVTLSPDAPLGKYTMTARVSYAPAGSEYPVYVAETSVTLIVLANVRPSLLSLSLSLSFLPCCASVTLPNTRPINQPTSAVLQQRRRVHLRVESKGVRRKHRGTRLARTLG